MNNWKDNIKLDDDELVTRYHSGFFNCEIQIRFMDTADKVQSKQSELVTNLIKNEADWIDKALDAILGYYKETYPHYRAGWEAGGADEETIEQCLPEEIDREKLLKLITPEELYINPEEECEDGSFGFGLECEWDIEHGIGVYFENWKVLDAGGMEVAFGY